jgi:hypothetical protein
MRPRGRSCYERREVSSSLAIVIRRDSTPYSRHGPDGDLPPCRTAPAQVPRHVGASDVSSDLTSMRQVERLTHGPPTGSCERASIRGPLPSHEHRCKVQPPVLYRHEALADTESGVRRTRVGSAGRSDVRRSRHRHSHAPGIHSTPCSGW